MKAVDTSIAVAAFGDWHSLNGPARAILDEGASLPVHALLETYSVLTGFPPPHRAAPDLVIRWLEERFAEILPAPEPEQQQAMIRTLASEGRTGGSTYDGVVALTSFLAGHVLVTADVRAVPVYKLIGVRFELLDLPG